MFHTVATQRAGTGRVGQSTRPERAARLILLVASLAATCASAWRLSARISTDGLLHRAIGTLLLVPAQLLLAVHLCGVLGAISRWPLFVAALATAACAWTAGASKPAPRISVRWQDPATWPVLPALLVFALSAWIVWRLPTWSWDCVWYHLPMTYYALQSGSTGWVDTHVWYVNGYPKSVELLAAWLVALDGSTRFDDGSQLLMAPLGAAAVMAWARRFGSTVEFALSAGACWVLLPAVFLQLHTTHADVAAGSFFITALYFLFAQPFDRAARIGAVLALALYASTKNLGLFHLALLGPLLAVRFARSGARPVEWIAAMVVLAAGCHTFIRNAVRTGNPLWPARVELPLVGATLPGELDERAIAGPPAFFRGGDAFLRMVKGWYLRSENYFPDVREGPFGLLFPYVALPALVAFTAWALWRREWWRATTIAAVCAVAVVVPAAWWGRFVLAVPAIALASLGGLLARAPRWLQIGAALAMLGASVEAVRHGWQGYRVIPRLSESAAETDARVRASIGWLWPKELADLRDRELGAGEVIAHDASISFLGELWNRAASNRVVYVPDDGQSLERFAAVGAKWVAVGWTSASIRELSRHPGEFEPLFDVPMTQARVFRVRPQGGRSAD